MSIRYARFRAGTDKRGLGGFAASCGFDAVHKRRGSSLASAMSTSSLLEISAKGIIPPEAKVAKISITADLAKSSYVVEEVMTLDSNVPRQAGPRTVQELRPSEVRWCYKSNLRDKLWEPLNGRDSLAIELAYRRHQTLLEQPRRASWISKPKVTTDTPHWTDSAVALGGLYVLAYDPGTNGVAPSPTSSVRGMSKSEAKVLTKTKATFPYYLKPTYWGTSRIHLARGTWFYKTKHDNWQPLDAARPKLVQLVEEQHMKRFVNQCIPEQKPLRKPKAAFPGVICQVNDPTETWKNPYSGVCVRWYAVDEVLLFNYKRSSRCCYNAKRPTGTYLMRGYHAEATESDGPTLVTDIIFVVHGIGQKWRGNTIGSCVQSMREACDQLLQSNFADLPQRPLFLPVDWRSNLELDEDLVAGITPDAAHPIRSFVNEALLDVLHYVSPVHGYEVARQVADVLNGMYRTYINHDPGFVKRKGRVSIVAHNLGSVIVHDILSVDKNAESSGVKKGTFGDRITLVPRAAAKLDFQVHHLFCLGSPLGVCLAIRNIKGKAIIHPAGGATGFRIHNIYHPADVLAYRLEPQISHVYAGVRPVQVHRFDANEFLSYDSMPTEVLKHQSHSVSGAVPKEETLVEAIGFDIPPVSDTVQEALAGCELLPKKDDRDVTKGDKKEKEREKDRSLIAKIPPARTLPYRIDFELRMKRVVSAYWAAINSHNNYWTNRDVVMYILSALYGPPRKITEKVPKKK